MLGRFLSADTIVPGAANPQAFNRYAYGLNNPVKYIDPTGHFTEQELIDFGAYTKDELAEMQKNDPTWWHFLTFAHFGDEIAYRGTNSFVGIFGLVRDRDNLNLAFASGGNLFSTKELRNQMSDLGKIEVFRPTYDGHQEQCCTKVWENGQPDIDNPWSNSTDSAVGQSRLPSSLLHTAVTWGGGKIALGIVTWVLLWNCEHRCSF